MRILLDENVPEPLLEPLRRLLGPLHHLDHVNHPPPGTNFAKSAKDKPLIRAAAADHYDAFLTKDLGQLDDPGETSAIKRSGLHHIRFTQADGMSGLGLAMASILAALADIAKELDHAQGQRLVLITRISPTPKRYTMTDPTTDPPAYWRSGRARRVNSRRQA